MQLDRDQLKTSLDALALKGVFIGTSSWKYPGWCGMLYDESKYITRGKFAKSRFERDCLTEYAEVFKTVCVDAGYYRFPDQRYIEKLEVRFRLKPHTRAVEFRHMNKSFEEMLAETLAKSCRAYIQHGAEHLFTKLPSDEDLLQAILNMQGAMEVVAKLYQLKTNGWRSILETKHHQESECELIKKLNCGKLKTTGYEHSKKHLIKGRELDKPDEDLLTKIQGYRNSLAHLGLPSLPLGIGDEIKRLLARVMNAMAW